MFDDNGQLEKAFISAGWMMARCRAVVYAGPRNEAMLMVDNDGNLVVYATPHNGGVFTPDRWPVPSGDPLVIVKDCSLDVLADRSLLTDVGNLVATIDQYTDVQPLLPTVIAGVTSENVDLVRRSLDTKLRPLLDKRADAPLRVTCDETGRCGLACKLADLTLRFRVTPEGEVRVGISNATSAGEYILPDGLEHTGTLTELRQMLIDGGDTERQLLLNWASSATRQVMRNETVEVNDNAPTVRVIGISGAPQLPLVAALIVHGQDACALQVGDAVYRPVLTTGGAPTSAEVTAALTNETLAALAHGDEPATDTVVFTKVLPGDWSAANFSATLQATQLLKEHLVNEATRDMQWSLGMQLPLFTHDEFVGGGVQLQIVFNNRAISAGDKRSTGVDDERVWGELKAAGFANAAGLAVVPTNAKVSDVVFDNNGLPRVIAFTLGDQKLVVAAAQGQARWAEVLQRG